MEKIKCSVCGENKSLDSFSFRNKIKGTRQKSCKECSRIKINGHYSKNKEYYKNKAKKRDIVLKKDLRTEIWDYLSKHPCVDCGEADHIVLEFDHVRGKKLKAISIMMTNRCSLESIKEEIKKCDVRCANCHKRRTSKVFGWWKSLPLKCTG